MLDQNTKLLLLKYLIPPPHTTVSTWTPCPRACRVTQVVTRDQGFSPTELQGSFVGCKAPFWLVCLRVGNPSDPQEPTMTAQRHCTPVPSPGATAKGATVGSCTSRVRIMPRWVVLQQRGDILWKRNRFMCYNSVAERCAFQSGSSKEGSRWDTSHKPHCYSPGCEAEPTSQHDNPRQAWSVIDGKDTYQHNDLLRFRRRISTFRTPSDHDTQGTRRIIVWPVGPGDADNSLQMRVIDIAHGRPPP